MYIIYICIIIIVVFKGCSISKNSPLYLDENIFEVCLKSNGICVTKSLLQFQKANYMLFSSKRVPKMIPLSLGQRKKSHEQDPVNWRVVSVQCCSFRLGTAGCSERGQLVHCRGEAATICPATILVSSHELMEACTTGSPCRLAD